MTVEKFLDCRKRTFFTSEKIIGLIILKAKANTETIMTYILNLEQKLSSFAFFFGRKNQCSVEDLITNSKPLMHGNNKSLFL